MRLRKRTAIVVCGVTLVVALASLYWWREAPERKVPRLLRELRDLPTGKFEIFYLGRSSEQIHTDLDRLGPRAVPALIEALDDTYPTIRYLAAGQLGRVRDPRAVKPLIRCVQKDPDYVVRAWAAGALGDIGDHRATDTLIASLKVEDSHLRFRAAKALGKIGDKRAFEPLVSLLHDKEIYLRAHAVEALGGLGDERAFEILLRILESDEDSWVRSMAAKGLGRLGDRRASAALTKAAADPSWQVNEAAMESLGRLQRK